MATTNCPQISIEYLTEGFSAPTPEEITRTEERIFMLGSVIIGKLSPTMVVKYGTGASVAEAMAMVHVAKHTSIPIPKVYACYRYGPIDRDLGDYGSLYDTYMFMDFIPGQSLDKVWDTLDDITKTQITNELKEYLKELRSLQGDGYIGTLGKGPCSDWILETSSYRGWNLSLSLSLPSPSSSSPSSSSPSSSSSSSSSPPLSTHPFSHTFYAEIYYQDPLTLRLHSTRLWSALQR
jgi:hypothetical protein